MRKRYRLHVGRKNHARAKAYCKSKKGKLAEPKSASDYNAIVALAKRRSVRSFWIGIHDKTKEGRFTYESDGKPIVWKNWNTGEPNNMSNEDCVESVLKGSKGKWNDCRCNRRRSFVCEMT